jgi:tetratricopeptide (TPR) repeat protein
MTALLLSVLLTQALASSVPSYYTPTEAQALFQEANAAYVKGDFAGARERYERLLEHGQGGADVLYNLGTTCLSEGKLGEAVLYLERAKRRGGAASDVDGNLNAARGRQVDQVQGEPASDDPVASRIADAVPRVPVTVAFVVLWAAGWLLLTTRRGRTVGLIVLLLGALPTGLLVVAHVVAERSVHEGVVVASTTPARELPTAEAKVAFEAHAGLKVRLLQEVGDYVRIQLPNGLEGWADRKAVTEI